MTGAHELVYHRRAEIAGAPLTSVCAQPHRVTTPLQKPIGSPTHGQLDLAPSRLFIRASLEAEGV